MLTFRGLLDAEQDPKRRRLMLAGFNELVASIQLGVRQGLGSQEEAVVSGIIKDAYRRLGVP